MLALQGQHGLWLPAFLIRILNLDYFDYGQVVQLILNVLVPTVLRRQMRLLLQRGLEVKVLPCVLGFLPELFQALSVRA